jgi:hypothetical protein
VAHPRNDGCFGTLFGPDSLRSGDGDPGKKTKKPA